MTRTTTSRNPRQRAPTTLGTPCRLAGAFETPLVACPRPSTQGVGLTSEDDVRLRWTAPSVRRARSSSAVRSRSFDDQNRLERIGLNWLDPCTARASRHKCVHAWNECMQYHA